MKNIKLLKCIYTVFALWLSGLLLTGCGPQKTDPYAPVIRTPQFLSVEPLGQSVQNRTIEMLKLGNGPDRILIIATIHGNEDAGTPLVYRLIDKLRERPVLLEGRTVLMIPIANPDGYVLRTRANASGIDLNRNFPASNRVDNDTNGQGGLTEPESAILHDVILTHHPAHIVTIHQPLYCLDYDGPADELAQAMSNFCPLPVKKLGSRPGSLGSFAGVEQNIPIITMELAESDSELTASQLWIKYGYALLAAVTFPELPY